jgi:lysophosphatidylcholine acyltransferase/lyso-PAF acetyltransferase
MTVGIKDEELKSVPLSGWRKKLRGSLRFMGRAIAFCFGFHHIKKNGQRSTSKKNVCIFYEKKINVQFFSNSKGNQATIFVAAPHTSFFDAFVFFVLGMPAVVSRDANGKIPLIGRLIKSVSLTHF